MIHLQNPDLAKGRQQTVLGLMETRGDITDEQRVAAEAAPLSYNPVPYPIEVAAFYLASQRPT